MCPLPLTDSVREAAPCVSATLLKVCCSWWGAEHDEGVLCRVADDIVFGYCDSSMREKDRRSRAR